MSVLRSAVAALDAHRGVPSVAELGLGLIRKLSVTPGNRVCALWVFGFVYGTRDNFCEGCQAQRKA
jgi:hypothetical protein